MLGSEYNWLLNLTYNSDGVPKVRLSMSGLGTLFIAVFCFLCIALQAGSLPGSPALRTVGGKELTRSMDKAERRATTNRGVADPMAR